MRIASGQVPRTTRADTGGFRRASLALVLAIAALLVLGCGTSGLHGAGLSGAARAVDTRAASALLTPGDVGFAKSYSVTPVDLTEPEFGCRNIPYLPSKGEVTGAMRVFTNLPGSGAVFLKLVTAAMVFKSADAANSYLTYVKSCFNGLSKTATQVLLAGPIGDGAIAFRGNQGSLHDLLVTWRSGATVGMIIETDTVDPSSTSAYTLVQKEQAHIVASAPS